MTALTILLVAAAVGFGASRITGLPAIPMLILGGVAISATVPLPDDLLQDALILGLNVMVFVAGIELSPGRLRLQRRAAILVGLVQFIVLGAVGMGAALALGANVQTAAYLGLAMTASSTLVVVRLLQTRQQLFEPFGRLVTGVLLLQDLLVVLAIPVITRLSDDWTYILLGLAATIVLIALAVVTLRWVGPLLIERLRDDEEILLILILAIFFTFIQLAQLFDLPLVSGAFLAGVSLSGFPVSALVRGQLVSLSDFFGALFFTALGAFLPIPSFGALVQAVLFALIVLVLTPPLVAFIAERTGFSARPALAAGLLLAQTSEFSLVVGLQGVLVGQISPDIFGIIVLTTLITMMATPLFATDRTNWSLMRLHPFKALRALPERPSGHVLLVGCGRSGLGLLELLVVSPHRIVVIDDDPALIHWLEESEIAAIRGDASDEEVLRAAGADRARVVVSTVRRREDNGPLLALVTDAPVFVRAFDVEDARWIEARGGRPVLYSEAAAEDFMAWFRSGATDQGSTAEPSQV